MLTTRQNKKNKITEQLSYVFFTVISQFVVDINCVPFYASNDRLFILV